MDVQWCNRRKTKTINRSKTTKISIGAQLASGSSTDAFWCLKLIDDWEEIAGHKRMNGSRIIRIENITIYNLHTYIWSHTIFIYSLHVILRRCFKHKKYLSTTKSRSFKVVHIFLFFFFGGRNTKQSNKTNQDWRTACCHMAKLEVLDRDTKA